MSDAPRRLQRVAAHALCLDGDAILLSRIAPGATASSDGMRTLPGVAVDFGENPRDAAIRELEEETGLMGEVVELAGVDSWTGSFVIPGEQVETDFHGIRILYRVRIVGGDLRDEVGGSSDTCRWVPAAELSSLPLVDLARLGAHLVGFQ